MPEGRGQVTPDSHFGRFLTHLALRCKTIVEIGTWEGMGTTKCLHLGMSDATQHLWTVEANAATQEIARAHYEGSSNITFVIGRVCHPVDFQPFTESYPSQNHKVHHDEEWELLGRCPDATNLLPDKIDLLVLDGGEWAGRGDFLRLADRATVIAMDDTNPLHSVKNVESRIDLIVEGWSVLADEPDDRHGWFVAARSTLWESEIGFSRQI